jgi:hypothetical protein
LQPSPNKIDFDGLTMAKGATANIVGTAGTPPTSLLTYLNAAAYLDSEGAPRDGNRSMIVEPFTGATIVDSLKGLFNPSDKIAEQYKRGLMGRDSAGLYWRMDQNVVPQTFGNSRCGVEHQHRNLHWFVDLWLGANLHASPSRLHLLPPH